MEHLKVTGVEARSITQKTRTPCQRTRVAATRTSRGRRLNRRKASPRRSAILSATTLGTKLRPPELCLVASLRPSLWQVAPYVICRTCTRHHPPRSTKKPGSAGRSRAFNFETPIRDGGLYAGLLKKRNSAASQSFPANLNRPRSTGRSGHANALGAAMTSPKATFQLWIFDHRRTLSGPDAQNRSRLAASAEWALTLPSRLPSGVARDVQNSH